MKEQKAKMRCPNCGFYYGWQWLDIPMRTNYMLAYPIGVSCKCCDVLLCLNDHVNYRVKKFIMIFMLIINIPVGMGALSASINSFYYNNLLVAMLETLAFIVTTSIFILCSGGLCIFLMMLAAKKNQNIGMIYIAENTKNMNAVKTKKLSKDKCLKCIEKYTPEKLAAFDQQIKDEN